MAGQQADTHPSNSYSIQLLWKKASISRFGHYDVE